MDTRSIPASSDVAFATTTARQTPTPPRATRFGEVLSNTVVQSAESVMRNLPGSPVMAVAVRSAAGTGALGIPMTNMAQAGTSPSLLSGLGASSVASGMGGIAGIGVPGSSATGNIGGIGGIGAIGGTSAAATSSASGPSVTGAGSTTDPTGIQASLQQSQDMNLYYLQVQETVNQQNRSYTTLSNVLKAEHDTVKNAIGNIR